MCFCLQRTPDVYVLTPLSSRADNLRNDTRYITSFLDAGWTNDVMAIVNTIYLGIMTSRVPILPPHVPMHVGKTTDFPFGDVFDVTRLRELVDHPMIEWRDVKTGIGLDYIGCWSVWERSHGNPRGSGLEYWLHLGEWLGYDGGPEMLNIYSRHLLHHGTKGFGNVKRP